MLLSLASGGLVAQASLGEDPLAVAVAADGRTAYVADNDPGAVIAVRLPSLMVAWRTHVSGAPSALLFQGGYLFVGLYAGNAVAELDPATGHILAINPAGQNPGELAQWQGGIVNGHGVDFGAAVAGGALWRTDRAAHSVVTGDRRVAVPAAPFWLEAGPGGQLLVAAEGDAEDTTPGAVVAIDTSTLAAKVLATPRDPDQVISVGDSLFVPAHGDHDVLVLRGGRAARWASGASAVALASDAPLGLLVVVTDARE